MSTRARLPIIAITGTKGKSTTTNMLASLLRTLGVRTLHVTTSGHYVDGQQKSTIADSKRIWGLKTPSLVPGRYMGDILSENINHDNSAAVLEASFSCYKAGLGYGTHKVGVFLNVFKDHIDTRSGIRNQQDLARAKSFIFSKISEDGWAVFNADDPHICEVLDAIPSDRTIRYVPCGRDFVHYDIETHLVSGGVAIQITNTAINLLSKDGSEEVYAYQKNDMTYGGSFMPAILNLAHACAAMYGFFDGRIPTNFQRALRALPLDYGDGRMSIMKNDNDITVIADYAHEKESLSAVATFARQYTSGSSGKLIGVVRLNHERPDETLREFGEVAGSLFDTVIVYDKIDGYWRQAKQSGIKRYPQMVGRTSAIVAEGAAHVNDNTKRIIREDEAIAYGATQASSGDVVVVIVNDDTARSTDFIKESFKLNPQATA